MKIPIHILIFFVFLGQINITLTSSTTTDHGTPTQHGDHPTPTKGPGDENDLTLDDEIYIPPFTPGQKFDYFKMGDDWPSYCAIGREQSPINIEATKGECDSEMVLDIQIIPVEWQVEEHHKFYTLQSDGNFTNLYATDVYGNLYGYTAWQFHLHSPSEHTIDGKFYDLEMHIVHYIRPEFQAKQRQFAVLGIMFEVRNDSQPFFEEYKLGTNFEESIFNMSKLLGSQIPLNPTYYHYVGGLTTPLFSACTEVVNWYLLDQILPITQAQYDIFSSRFQKNPSFAGGNGNNRRTQPLNGRVVKKGGIICEENFLYFFTYFLVYMFVNYFIFKIV